MRQQPGAAAGAGGCGRRRLRRMGVLIITGYGLLALAVWVFQRRLLYLPSTMPLAEEVALARENGLVPWTNAMGGLLGWQIPADPPVAGSVLILHGNAGCAAMRGYLAQPLHAAGGLNVFILEYPGYGARPGQPGRASINAAVEEAFLQLPPGPPRYVVSESIGTGPAADLAARHPGDIAGMAMLAPYDNLAAVAQRRFWFLPAGWLLLDRFAPAAALGGYHGPVKFVVAGDDEIIGPATGRRLAEGYQGPKELEVAPGAHHNEVAEQTPAWWRDTLAFWRQTHGGRGTR